MFHKIIGTTHESHNVSFALGGEQCYISSAYLVIEKDGEKEVSYPLSWDKNDGSNDLWSVTIAYMSTGLYFYYFDINGGIRLGCNEDHFCVEHSGRFQLTVYDQNYDAPTWLEGGIMYQIMVDRFCAVNPDRSRSNVVYRDDWGGVPNFKPVDGKILNNDFFGGNLKGVISKLDYLASLNVTCIYMNPIFKANSNHKYDTADYYCIDPSFGTNADLEELVAEAKTKGMTVVLDGVFSHTGDDSIYFNKYGHFQSLGAAQSVDSPYYNWYKFSRHPEHYDSWWGIDTLPEVNETESSYLDFITGEHGVIKYWLDKGIAGWRLDVADELPDTFIAQLTARAKSVKKDALVLGEVWEDASIKTSYSARRKYFLGNELDSVTNYVYRSSILGYLRTGAASSLARSVQSLVYHYPPRVLNVLMNVIGTHDTPRMLTMLSGADGRTLTRDERAYTKLNDTQYDFARRKLFLAAVLQYTLPGVPCVFYGDEAGIEGYEDPFNRRTYPWGLEDKSILDFYRTLGRIRTQATVLKSGAYRCLYAFGNVFVFCRSDDKHCLRVGVNLGNTPYILDKEISAIDMFTNSQVNKLVIPPMGFAIVESEIESN